MLTSYTPGVPGLGVPALLMTDSSMGIVNLDIRRVTRPPRSCGLVAPYRAPNDRPP
jgi:hypothetical protein